MVRFDASVSGSQKIDFGNFFMPPGTNQFTMCAFMSYDRSSSDSDNRVFGQYNGGSNQAFSLILDEKSNDSSKRVLQFRLNTGSVTAFNTVPLSPSKIYHVAGVYNGSEMTVFVNGKEVGSTGKTGNITVQDTWNLVIGNRPDNQRSFEGLIGDCRVYNRVLSPEELADIIETNGNDLNDDGLLFHAPLDGPEGTVLTGSESVVDYTGGEYTAQNGGTPSGNPVYEEQIYQSETPSNMTNVFAWFDASEQASMISQGYFFNNSVSTWFDRNISSRNMVAGSTPEIDEVVINGNSTLNFDSFEYLNADFLNTTSGLVNKKYAIFIVERKANTQGNQWILGGSGSTNNTNLHIGYRNSNEFSFAQWGNDINVVSSAYQSANVTRLHTVINDSSGKFLRLNGTQVGSSTNTQNLTDYPDPELGRRPTTDDGYAGALCEIVIFDRILADTEIDQVEKYLMTKWGI